MSALKPCPFCGSEASIARFEDNDATITPFLGVNCVSSKCLSKGSYCATEAEASAAWNQRTTAHSEDPERCEKCDNLHDHFELAEDFVHVAHPYMATVFEDSGFCVICHNRSAHPWHEEPPALASLEEIKKYLDAMGFKVVRAPTTDGSGGVVAMPPERIAYALACEEVAQELHDQLCVSPEDQTIGGTKGFDDVDPEVMWPLMDAMRSASWDWTDAREKLTVGDEALDAIDALDRHPQTDEGK